MAGEQKSQGGKEEIKKGMDEAGRHPTSGSGAAAGTRPGKDKGSDEVTKGMAKSGSGRPTGGEGSGGKAR